MNKNTILSGLFILCFAMAASAMESESPHSYWHQDLDDTSSTSTEAETQKMRQLQALRAAPSVAVGAAGGVLFLYGQHLDFRSMIDGKLEGAKHLLLQKAVVPAFLKVSEIKREGVSFTDVVRVGGVLVGGYGIKKGADFFGLWRACKGDLSKARQALKECAGYLAANKLKISGVLLVALTAFGCYKLWAHLKKHVDVDVVDQFFLTLTSEQRKKIMISPPLADAIEQVNSDPTSIGNHEEFMHMLTQQQKELLDHIVAQYLQNNPHLALEG